MNRPYYHVTTKTLCALVARGFPDAPLRRIKHKVLSATGYYDVNGSVIESAGVDIFRIAGANCVRPLLAHHTGQNFPRNISQKRRRLH